MALIGCPKCNKQVSDKAHYCPHCGYNVGSKQSNSKLNNILNYIVKRPIIIVVAIVLIVGVVVLAKWDKPDTSHRNYGSSSNYSYSTTDNNTNSSSIFNNLTISNFSASLGQHGGKMTCEVKNNNNFTVKGYFYVGFYDSTGTLMYSQLMSLPSVSSGESVICSTLIPKDDYPTGYKTVKYSQATLVKD